MADKIKCEHAICTCMINEEEEYCSPQCENQATFEFVDVECECGHTTCETARVKVTAAP